MTPQGFARMKARMLSAWPFQVRFIEEAGWDEWLDALARYDDAIVDAAVTAMRDGIGDRTPSLSLLMRHIRAEVDWRRDDAILADPCRCYEVPIEECPGRHTESQRRRRLAEREAMRIVLEHERRSTTLDPHQCGTLADAVQTALAVRANQLLERAVRQDLERRGPGRYQQLLHARVGDRPSPACQEASAS